MTDTYLPVVREATQRSDVLDGKVSLSGGRSDVTFLPDAVNLLVHLPEQDMNEYGR